MAHYQKHGAHHDAVISSSLQGRLATNHTLAISEDEVAAAAELDDPPEPSSKEQQNFSKSILAPSLARRESLLTQALHTDSEFCADEDAAFDAIKHAASISSACSTFSGRSVWDFNSDDGQVSAGTRASTPGSPRTMAAYEKHFTPFLPRPLVRISSHPVTSTTKNEAATPEKPKEGDVEATLGRKRCITFACANRATPTPAKDAVKPPPASNDKQVVANAAAQEQPKRPCTIKFACPFKGSSSPKGKSKFGRHLSPAPPIKKTTASSSPSPRRFHRDSDTTIRNSSPMPINESTPTIARLSRCREKSPVRGEKMKCHIFASSDDEEDDWVQESTVHRSRLTVDDTLVKENKIRRLGEEAEEEALEEDDDDDLGEAFDDDDDDDNDDDDEDLVSDEGFQTDDEEGFAESDDDENGSDSDYEWWTPRRTKSSSPFVSHRHLGGRPTPKRSQSGSSTDSLGDFSPKRQSKLTTMKEAKKSSRRRAAQPVDIKPDASDLPDSTDFVCGTLDEDKPLEEAYITNLKQFQASKHKTVPQDIDPTFPTSDPEMDMDEEDDDEEENAAFADDGEHPNFFGANGHAALDEEFRGRKPSTQRSSPVISPKRLHSPKPLTRRPTLPRSPAPPRVKLSPSPAKTATTTTTTTTTTPAIHRTKSPHPNAWSSPESKTSGLAPMTLKRHALFPSPLGKITHTSSLPRSPAPIGRKLLLESAATTGHSTPIVGVSDDEDDNLDPSNAYTRKAIDIKQGLEHKRLRRRQKLYSIYAHKAEKKKAKRPAPGKGADRMRQVGIDCARYKGKRMLSL